MTSYITQVWLEQHKDVNRLILQTVDDEFIIPVAANDVALVKQQLSLLKDARIVKWFVDKAVNTITFYFVKGDHYDSISYTYAGLLSPQAGWLG